MNDVKGVKRSGRVHIEKISIPMVSDASASGVLPPFQSSSISEQTEHDSTDDDNVPPEADMIGTVASCCF